MTISHYYCFPFHLYIDGNMFSHRKKILKLFLLYIYKIKLIPNSSGREFSNNNAK